MPERTFDLIKIILTAILGSLIVIPPLILIIKRSGRMWLKIGVEGDNGKPDLHEIWEALFMFMALGCFFTMVFMIIDKSLTGTVYEIHEYAMVFSGTLGSNTASAFIMWLKQTRTK